MSINSGDIEKIQIYYINLLIFLILTLVHSSIVFRKRERDKGEGERETWMQERHRLPLMYTQTRDQTSNLGTCPGQELNQQYFGYRTVLEATEPHWPGLILLNFKEANSLLKIYFLGFLEMQGKFILKSPVAVMFIQGYNGIQVSPGCYLLSPRVTLGMSKPGKYGRAGLMENWNHA